MKFKQLLYLFLFIVLPLISFGKDMPGDAAYAKGQYQEARDSYKKLINAGNASAALYFNMGNACFKTDDIPSAILYYEKARILSPGDEDINFNIRFANQKTTDRIEDAPEFFLFKWWRGFILSISLSALAILSIIAIALAGLTLVWYLFSQSENIKKATFYAAITLFLVGIVFIFMGNRQSAYFETHKQAIVFGSSVTVKSTPNDGGKTLFLIHAGTKVNVTGSSNNQIKISLGNGSTGWIAASEVKEI